MRTDSLAREQECKTELVRISGRLEAYESGAIEAFMKAMRKALHEEGLVQRAQGR